jgi:uracil-DNA glycosylase
VQAGTAGSDRGTGWEEITGAVVSHLATRPLAAVLWGRQAQSVAGLVGEDRCVMSAHPSPLSAYRGFFGSRPFSRVNEILAAQGAAPVDWSLADQEVAQ